MAAAEGKPETKQKAKVEAKPESKEAGENQEPPLKYKAWVLKVSIHCEGCKKKVEKTLRKIDGVYEAYADLKQQKAMIKAKLDVAVETLIKKLAKKGRQVELWPEKAEQKEKKQGKSKNKDKQGGQANSEAANNNINGDDKEKEKVENEVSVQQHTAKSCDNGSSSKNAEGCNVGNPQEGGASGGQVEETKPQVKQTVTLTAGDQSPAAEEKGGGESEDDTGGGGGGGGGGSASGSKKSKKKGKKGNANANFDGGEHSDDAGHAGIESHFTPDGPRGPIPMPSPASHSSPRQHHTHEYPAYYHAPQVHVTSYNSSYPSSSHSASYYTSPPPYSYMYMYPGHVSEHPLSDTNTYASQPSDSFEMFSDENPNACSIM